MKSIAHLGLLDDDVIMPEVAALQLSALDHEGVDLAPYSKLLAEMTQRIGEVAGLANTAAEQSAALRQVLAHEYGFAGDEAGYDAPVNTDMIRVLDRRRGLPVSLSILYVGIARRLGWIAFALNTPSHVLIRVGDHNDGRLLAPFNGGVEVSRSGLAALIARARGEGSLPSAGDVAPMSNRMLLSRLLLNQATRAEASGDRPRALAVFQRIATVDPGRSEAWWEVARLHLEARAYREARNSLNAMLEVTRDAKTRRRIAQILKAIESN